MKTGAALFFGKDEAGNVRQCSERATDGTPNKKDTYGSDRSYCFFSEARAPCTSVSVFESAIDLMSFATIMKRRGLDYRRFHMLSLSGVYLPGKNEQDFRIPASLERFLREYPDTKAIYLHLDSDYAGRRGAAGFITVLGDRYDVRYLPPKYGKDYNDYLMHLIHLENLKTEKTCHFDKDKSHVQSVVDSMAGNKKFNPILCWKYTPVTACEVVMEEADYGIRHNSLFPCGGKLIAERTNDATENFGFVYDRNELWLLRNMTFAVTRRITYGNCEGERMTYRYFIGNDLDCFRKYCEADDILARVRELIRENESQFEV